MDDDRRKMHAQISDNMPKELGVLILGQLARRLCDNDQLAMAVLGEWAHAFVGCDVVEQARNLVRGGEVPAYIQAYDDQIVAGLREELG